MADNFSLRLDTMTAPWSLDSRFKLVVSALVFFGLDHLAKRRVASGRNPVEPPSGAAFIKYLEEKKIFPVPPNALQVEIMLRKMVSAGLLSPVATGQTILSYGGVFSRCYVYLPTRDKILRDPFHLASVLGPEWLHRLCAPILVHISGTKDDAPVAGTGLVVDEHHVLTCRHVVSDMELDETQVFQDKPYAITAESIHRHPEIDVAVVRVDGPPLSVVSGITLMPPTVTQVVYTLGYPKLPGLREASVIIQQGAVTNESVTSLAGETLFLYSAIARPGNSGGPVMSEDGYLVGLSVVDAVGQYDNEGAFSPHYAGVPAQVLAKAVDDLNLGIRLPFEEYE